VRPGERFCAFESGEKKKLSRLDQAETQEQEMSPAKRWRWKKRIREAK
jgi:hypothetical protein